MIHSRLQPAPCQQPLPRGPDATPGPAGGADRSPLPEVIEAMLVEINARFVPDDDDKTAIELFLVGIQGWEAGLRHQSRVTGRSWKESDQLVFTGFCVFRQYAASSGLPTHNRKVLKVTTFLL